MGEVKQEGQGYGFFGERVDRRGLDSVGNETGPKRRGSGCRGDDVWFFFELVLTLALPRDWVALWLELCGSVACVPLGRREAVYARVVLSRFD